MPNLPETTATIAERNKAFAALGGNFDLIDLSDTLGPETVIWPGAPAPEFSDLATFELAGYHARVVTIFEHSGTHFDAPDHFVPGGSDTSEISIDDLVLAVRVIDIRDAAKANPNAVLLPEHVEAHEKEHGLIPAGVAVLLNTGWAEVRKDPARYAGDPLAFPGFGVQATTILVERGVVGVGIDTLGIDPGDQPDFPVHKHVSHPAGLWHLENLINVDKVPATGAVLVAAVPKIAGGSGFPTRVFAFVPRIALAD